MACYYAAVVALQDAPACGPMVEFVLIDCPFHSMIAAVHAAVTSVVPVSLPKSASRRGSNDLPTIAGSLPVRALSAFPMLSCFPMLRRA